MDRRDVLKSLGVAAAATAATTAHWRSGGLARVFGIGLATAGLVDLTGSALRFFAPHLSAAFAPAYGVTILAETAFCLRLLLQRAAA